MAVIKNLDVVLGVQNQQFNKKLEQSSKKAGEFSGQVSNLGGGGRISGGFNRLTSGIGNVGGALGALGPAGIIAAAGVVALDKAFDAVVGTITSAIAIFKEVSREIVEIDRVANRLDLSSAEGQILSLAGTRIGRDLEDVADLVNEINLKIGEANFDNEGLAEAFDRIGLSSQELARIDSSLERAQLVIDAVARIESTTDRAALADQIFGGDAARIASDLAGQINRAAEAQDRFNLGLNDLNTADIAAVRGEFADIRLQFELFTQKAVAEAAPAILRLLELANDLADVFGDVGSLIEAIGINLEAMSVTVSSLVESLARSTVAFESVAKTIVAFNVAGSAIETLFETSPVGQLTEGFRSEFQQNVSELTKQRIKELGEARRAQQGDGQADVFGSFLVSGTAELLAKAIENTQFVNSVDRLARTVEVVANDAAAVRGSQADFASTFTQSFTKRDEPLAGIERNTAGTNEKLDEVIKNLRSQEPFRVVNHNLN